MSDRCFRYARLADPADRFAEAEGPLEQLIPAQPSSFPPRPGALNALLGSANSELSQTEDAFQVRVQAPDGATKAPVIVFLPGGGFLSGGGNARWFSTPAWLQRSGAVLVTVTYRVGVWGHLGPTGQPQESQRGLRDVLCSLRWVHRHIGSLGGDPENITLGGDSAGAWYAYAAAILPETSGLYRRLALVSLPRENPLSPEDYAERRSWYCAELGGESRLATASVDELLEVQGRMARRWTGRGMPLMPASGGCLPPNLHRYLETAAGLRAESLLLLTTSEEAAAFLYSAPEEAFGPESVAGFLTNRFTNPARARRLILNKRPEATPKQQMIEAMTLHQFHTAQLELAAAASAQMPVYVLGLSAQSRLPGAFSPHCYPLPFLFGTAETWHDAPMLRHLPEAEFQQLAVQMEQLLVGFAVSGAPDVSAASTPVKPFDAAAPLRYEIEAGGVFAQTPPETGLSIV